MAEALLTELLAQVVKETQLLFGVKREFRKLNLNMLMSKK
ncbi:hypothetical protein COLO4_22305 [Corchorus olitorius]|uniref:Uncharacterized protein n=1 Tax=Corchorus olitorius TaxID=93759 RepID=A0A1R3IMZ1_9ROSI|nr:hypothetical protein COLO4_22305 [Corchorus olitorius]